MSQSDLLKNAGRWGGPDVATRHYRAAVLSNNNNAEHALRAFTRLRNIMTTSTPKGHREYATLLSIQQTLRYRGMGFLEFMRTGRMGIDG